MEYPRHPLSHVEWLYIHYTGRCSEDEANGINLRIGFNQHCPAKVDLKPKSLRLRLGHLQMGELHHWHLCHPCIALELVVQFKLKSSNCAWTQIWVRVQLSSSVPHCIKWADDQHNRARASASAQPSPPLNPHYNRSSGHWNCVMSCLVGSRDKYSPRYRLGHFRVGELHHWPLLPLYSTETCCPV